MKILIQMPSEVTEDCKFLGLPDWSKVADPPVSLIDSGKIMDAMGLPDDTDPDQFRKGIHVELEHGSRYPDANITNNHPIMTGMIVIAHLKEDIDYYRRLEIMELEAQLFKARIKRHYAEQNRLSALLGAARDSMALSVTAQLEAAGGK